MVPERVPVSRSTSFCSYIATTAASSGVPLVISSTTFSASVHQIGASERNLQPNIHHTAHFFDCLPFFEKFRCVPSPLIKLGMCRSSRVSLRWGLFRVGHCFVSPLKKLGEPIGSPLPASLHLGSSLPLFILIRLIDHEAAGIVSQFPQLLIALVPFGAGFVDENASLVRPSELHEAGLADVGL